MTPTFRCLLLSAAGLSAILTATAAAAQDTAAPTDLQEIVVTAQKREQAAIDVPMALTAYSGERLQALGVEDFADLAKFTPGFEVQDQSPNNPGFVMRGITSDSTDTFSEARVSVFQDGVSISKAQGSYVELFDLERVEVAKGPQSTLYGRGALIGAVNVIQAKADPAAFDAAARLELGDFGYRQGEAMVNLPLSDTLGLRVAGRMRQRDGYVENALGGDAFQSVDSSALRVALGFEPSDTFRADLIVNWQQDQPTGTAFKSGGFSPTNPATGAVLSGRDPWSAAALAAPTGFVGKPLGVDRTVQGVTGLMTWELSSDFTLSSISAYREFESEEVYDPDGLSLAILTGLNHGEGTQWSQELRVNYDAGGRLKAFVGADVFREEGTQVLPLQFDERIGLAVLTGQLNASAAGSGLPATTPAPLAYFGNTAFTGALVRGMVASLTGNGIVLPSVQAQAIAANLRANHVETATNTSELTSVDLFADATFAVTDKLELSAGLRYTRDDKDTGFASSVAGRSVLGGVIGATQLYNSGRALIATGVPAQVTQGNALVAQANGILGALTSPAVQSFPASALPMFGLTFQPTNNNGDAETASLEDDGFTWRVVGRYALSDDANLYASYARGRRPQVLATAGPAAPYGAARFQAVEAETVDSYEVGGKFALLEGRLRLDTSLYFYNYQNFQTVEQQGTLFVITNAGEAKSYGFEGQAEWRAAPNLDLYATYAYSHARFDGGAYDGNHFRLSPDHTLSVGASWTFDALGGTFDVRPGYSWQSKVYFDDNNDLPAFQQTPRVFVADNLQNEVQDAYGLVDLRVTFRPESGNWTLGAFVTNLTDEPYIIDAGNTGDSLGLPTFIAGAPRMTGLSIGWKY
ncbi:MAG: TonB-dependent receptor [Caulobacter sp.]